MSILSDGPNVATFSIVARDPATGDLGVAVASKFLAVGAYVPFAEAGVGAVATQAHMNTRFGPEALRMMAEGRSAAECIARFRATDAGIATRQVGIVSASGGSATHTGDACHDWAGGVAESGLAAQGNILSGPGVLDALVRTFTGSSEPFPERLLAALAAADAAGGDRRGRQSAALLVVGADKGYGGTSDRWIDLRVDDRPAPIPELRRLLELHRLFLDRPSQPPRQLSEKDIRWLQRLLLERGHDDRQPTGRWDDRTEAALESLFGVENLEERWTGGSFIDPVAWEYLWGTYGGEGP
ncbi:MAG: DUF1028 domain-containing protein [Deinococcales bacterium]